MSWFSRNSNSGWGGRFSPFGRPSNSNSNSGINDDDFSYITKDDLDMLSFPKPSKPLASMNGSGRILSATNAAMRPSTTQIAGHEYGQIPDLTALRKVLGGYNSRGAPFGAAEGTLDDVNETTPGTPPRNHEWEAYQQHVDVAAGSIPQVDLESMGVRYTRTGRISKPKKGRKVHKCYCGRSYTRAEHLRRHQKSHAEDALVCNFPMCGKTFYRIDLLQRHQEQHSATRSEPAAPAEAPVTMRPRVRRGLGTKPLDMDSEWQARFNWLLDKSSPAPFDSLDERNQAHDGRPLTPNVWPSTPPLHPISSSEGRSVGIHSLLNPESRLSPQVLSNNSVPFPIPSYREYGIDLSLDTSKDAGPIQATMATATESIRRHKTQRFLQDQSESPLKRMKYTISKDGTADGYACRRKSSQH